MSFFDEGLQKEMQLKLLKAMSGDENYTIEDYTNEFSNTNALNSGVPNNIGCSSVILKCRKLIL